MSAPTMERATARHPNDLIRIVDDVELPAVGRWTIGRGQRVTLIRRRLRRRTFEASVLDGTFTVTDDPAGSSLDLSLSIPDFAGHQVRISSRSARSIDVGYHGVFRQRGRPPSMWLDLRAAFELPELRDVMGRGQILLDAELNLNRELDGASELPTAAVRLRG